MSSANSYIRTHLVAVAAGAALIAAVLIAGGLAAALIGHVPVPDALRGGDDGGSVPLADARRAPRGSLHHGPVARPRRTAPRRAAPIVASGPVLAAVRAQGHAKRARKAHHRRTRTRKTRAPVSTPAAPSASAVATARHDNGRHLGQTRTTHDNGRHVGQIRKSSPSAARTTPAARPHGNPHGGPPGQAGKSHRPPGHSGTPPGHMPGHSGTPPGHMPGHSGTPPGHLPGHGKRKGKAH